MRMKNLAPVNFSGVKEVRRSRIWTERSVVFYTVLSAVVATMILREQRAFYFATFYRVFRVINFMSFTIPIY